MAVVLDPEQAETRVIHELVDFTGMDVLDVGCGDGRMTWRFAEATHSVLGLDPVAEAVNMARAGLPERLKDRVSFHVADITTVELSRAAFDVAVLSWSLC